MLRFEGYFVLSPLRVTGRLLASAVYCSLTLLAFTAAGNDFDRTERLHAAPNAPVAHIGLTGEAIDLSRWHPDYAERCYFPDREESRSATVAALERLIGLIASERTLGRALYAKARHHKTAFCIEDRADGSRGYFDHKLNIIAARESLGFHEKLVILVHELRHLDQYSKGFCPSLEYHMEEMARMTLAMEADAQSVATLFAWRVSGRHRGATWHALSGLEHYEDVSRAFLDELLETDDELKATLAAFVQWYSSPWRRSRYYKGSCMGYLDMLDEEKLIQRYDELPDDFFDDLCLLPTGQSYECHLTEEIRMEPSEFPVAASPRRRTRHSVSSDRGPRVRSGGKAGTSSDRRTETIVAAE